MCLALLAVLLCTAAALCCCCCFTVCQISALMWAVQPQPRVSQGSAGWLEPWKQNINSKIQATMLETLTVSLSSLSCLSQCQNTAAASHRQLVSWVQILCVVAFPAALLCVQAGSGTPIPCRCVSLAHAGTAASCRAPPALPVSGWDSPSRRGCSPGQGGASCVCTARFTAGDVWGATGLPAPGSSLLSAHPSAPLHRGRSGLQ